MSRRGFLQRSLAAGLGAALRGRSALAASDAGGGKPSHNILWIGVDDLCCDLGCYGVGDVHSPHIDALASRGVTFANAHVQQAVCAASRASLLTGCRPDTTTVDYPYNDHFTKTFLPEHPAVPRYFFDQGAYAVGFGKIHHGPPLDLAQLSEPYDGANRIKLAPWYQSYADPKNQALAEAKRKDSTVMAPPYESADVEDEAYVDGRLAQKVCDTLRRVAETKQPFFLAAGFIRPHLPFCAPKRYWDLYDRDALELPAHPLLGQDVPGFARASFELPTYAGELTKGGKPLDEETTRLLKHGYYACVSFVDAQIGKVLAQLDALGLADRTTVMLWSDHGFHLGENQSWGKHTCFERATRAPLIVAGPDVAKGRTAPGLVEYVDMFPTLCELAEVPAPEYLEGLSFAPLLQKPDRSWKGAAFSQYPRNELEGYAIRTERYRYVEWRGRAGKGEITIEARELYDHRDDPGESVNLAEREESEALVASLSKRLAAGPSGELPGN